MRQVLTTLFALLAVVACGSDDQPDRAVGELASDRIELSAESNEPITRIDVAEGTVVSTGDVLVVQDSLAGQCAPCSRPRPLLGQAQARLDELVRGPSQRT